MDLFLILLFLHVIGAIAAFGPSFASMVVAPMVAKEPQYANFYARTQASIGRRLVTPLSISLAITGIGMILARGWGNLVAGKHWLEVAILLYVVTVVLSMAVLAPAGRKLVALTSTPAAGPSDELRKVAGRLRTGGIALSALVVVITLLMVTKPF